MVLSRLNGSLSVYRVRRIKIRRYCCDFAIPSILNKYLLFHMFDAFFHRVHDVCEIDKILTSFIEQDFFIVSIVIYFPFGWLRHKQEKFE